MKHENKQRMETKDTCFCEECFIDILFLVLEILKGRRHFVPTSPTSHGYISWKTLWWIALILYFFLLIKNWHFSGSSFIRFNSKFVFPDPEPPIINILYGWSNLWPTRIMFFCFFFYNIIKVNHFLYPFIILLHLISSFSLIRSLLIPYACVSIESNDCILSSSFELNAILLISSVKTMWKYYLWFLLSILILFFSRYFILFSSLVASKHFL